MWDILIQNGTVIDGTGKDAFAADIAVADGKIVKIGSSLSGSAKRVIDATGRYVTPGFIDMHSHSDCTVPFFPDMEGTLAQGVTSVFTGHCGLSVAPVDKYWLPMFHEARAVNHLTGDHDWLVPGYTTPVETDALRPQLKKYYGVDADWRTFGEYLDHLEHMGIGANMLCVVGHAPLRLQVLGYDSSRPAEEGEIAAMCAMLRREMASGALGLGLGLDYDSGIHAKTEELIALARVVAEYDGIVTAHVRGCSPGYMGGNVGMQPIDGIRELLEIGLQTGVHVHISHIYPGFLVSDDSYMQQRSAQRTLQIVNEYREKGVRATWDIIPVSGLFYMPELAGKLTPYISLCGGKKAFAKKLSDASYKKWLANEIKAGRHLSKTPFCRIDPVKNPHWADRLVITSCKVAAHEGKALAALAQEAGVDPVDLMLDILQQDMDTCFVQKKAPGFRGLEDAVEWFIAQEEASLAFDGATYNFDAVDEVDDLPRIYGAPATYSGMVTFLLKHREQRLEENIKRMTGNAARALGLKDRGFLAEGMAGDIVIFRYEELDDRINEVDPRSAPAGIDFVLVNGAIAVEQGTHSHIRAGRVLRRDQIHAKGME